jgi:arsenite-transporting ATPase
MSKVQVFEPALCCATGVCGEDVDQALVTFSADMDFVRSRGGDISRHNLAREPLAITETDTAGSACCSSDGSTAGKCC